MSSVPTNYNYIKAKDAIKWIGLKPKKYIPILDAIFRSYQSGIKTK